MPKLIIKRSKKIGLPPGTPMYVGEKKIDRVKIKIIDYDEVQFQEKESKTVEECFPFKDKPTVTWINIDGIHQVDIIEKIGNHFNIHPLVSEDIVNTGQRPKMEDFVNYIFVILKMLYYDEKINETKAEQISLILGSNFVISFQENEGDVFDPKKMGEFLVYSGLLEVFLRCKCRYRWTNNYRNCYQRRRFCHVT